MQKNNSGTFCTMKNIERTVKIFGCGNVIMGDDGFGPAVVDELNGSYILPRTIEAVDVGTCIREYLFDYLLSEDGRPDMIVIIDAVDFSDRRPGEVFQIHPGQIPAKKIHDFSLHQFPTVNLLQELEQHTGINIVIIAGQIYFIPDEIGPGLSSVMSQAVTEACSKISDILSLSRVAGTPLCSHSGGKDCVV